MKYKKYKKKYIINKFNNIPKHNINEKILSKNVLVIDENNKNIGILDINSALSLSREKELDLVEINSNNNPPVCRILNYEKFLYNVKKKEKKIKLKNQKTKIIKLNSISISENDLDRKIKSIINFYKKKIKTKVIFNIKNKNKFYKENALKIINKIINIIEIECKIDKDKCININENEINLIV